MVFTEYWVTCTEYFNPNVLSWDLLHYVVHSFYCHWLMLYHKYSVDIIMPFTCIISVLMITHHHQLVVMWYVWLSFTVSFLFLSCCQYCAWTELQLVLPVSCLETAFFFYKSSPLACHLSCFGVSDFCIVQELKTSM